MNASYVSSSNCIQHFHPTVVKPDKILATWNEQSWFKHSCVMGLILNILFRFSAFKQAELTGLFTCLSGISSNTFRGEFNVFWTFFTNKQWLRDELMTWWDLHQLILEFSTIFTFNLGFLMFSNQNLHIWALQFSIFLFYFPVLWIWKSVFYGIITA